MNLAFAATMIRPRYLPDSIIAQKDSASAFLHSLGLPSDFVRKGLLLLRSGYVRELAAASYPHIQCGGGDFPGIAGGVCGERRLA